ncbi:hypothetical protein CLN94_04980 [Pseudothioclava arenosa]|uniref:Uncharacterized protein n=1 Tax=Pseudothioclava arenosa TaxID=1795308 RepID=A0A2A4CS73_9RHOB|nr:hypothetical protein CLN94_04980 [Pseudothioclava arenosa]
MNVGFGPKPDFRSLGNRHYEPKLQLGPLPALAIIAWLSVTEPPHLISWQKILPQDTNAEFYFPY